MERELKVIAYSYTTKEEKILLFPLSMLQICSAPVDHEDGDGLEVWVELPTGKTFYVLFPDEEPHSEAGPFVWNGEEYEGQVYLADESVDTWKKILQEKGYSFRKEFLYKGYSNWMYVYYFKGRFSV